MNPDQDPRLDAPTQSGFFRTDQAPEPAASVEASVDLEPLLEPVPAVEALARRFLQQRNMPENLRQAVLYALMGPGKRMRPVLCVHSAVAVGGDRERALPAAAAVEMIHAFSLVHDDLPALDDDDLRRGRPTLHKHTNEAMAILAGDALMGLAFELIGQEAPLPCRHLLLSELAGATNDMIAGQVWDTLPDFAQDVPDEQRLLTIHRHKTQALIRVACRMGALSVEANPQQLQAVTDYAQAIGLMFQIVDDLLDVTQSTEHLGKTAGKDAQQDKLTYPGLIGIEASQREVQRLHRQAHQALEPLGAASSPLARLSDWLAVRTR